MDYSKIIGWIVFFAGLSIIVWTLWFSYGIITGGTALPEFFTLKEKMVEKSGSQDMEIQIQEAIGEQLSNIIPANYITQIFNMAIWSVIAFLFILGGFQIGNLGIKLIKK